jgi:4-diphosphocytidyl-2-C-methyl-D-erythritol kinase
MPDQLNRISIQAPGKVNLTLAVLGQRPDGFHEIESWVVKIEWYDQLSFSPARELSLTLSGEAPGVAADESNLVLRAARAMAEESGVSAGAEIVLEKQLPVGAGLGGGSSDAAATLKGLNKLWGLNWETERLQSIGGQIGSDVPLFLEDARAVVIRGRGERVEPLPSAPHGWLALIVPTFAIATAEVYRAADACKARSQRAAQPWLDSPHLFSKLQHELFNDLEEPAISVEPRLARLFGALKSVDGRRVHLTGSGSCVFTVFDTEPEARIWKQAALTMADQAFRIEVVTMT